MSVTINQYSIFPTIVLTISNNSGRIFVAVFVMALLTLPWINPVASGPSPSTYPWLASSSCSILIYLLRSKIAIPWIGRMWLFAACISCAAGLIQYFGVGYTLGGFLQAGGVGEAYANLRQRNQFATLTAIGLIALLWVDRQSPLLPTKTKYRRIPANFPMLALLALGNAASSSRTGFLQWCLVFLLTLWWSRETAWNSITLCSFALISYAVGTLALPAVLELWIGTSSGGLLARFAEDPGCASRRVLWSNVLHLIAQKPWFGWGWGELDYAHFITLYPNERFCDILDNAHNLPLHLAVELGLPAALVFCSGVVWWVWRNKPWAEQNATRQMAWAVLAVIALHSLLEYPLWYGPFQMAVGLCLLLLWRTHPSRQRSDFVDTPIGTRPNRIFDWITRVGAVLCLVALAAAAWDYWRVSQLYKIPKQREPQYQVNTLEKVRDSWFFQDQVQFAELMTVPLDKTNAAHRYAQAQRLLHFSPEPRVIEAVIESAVMLGKNDEAVYYAARYKAAFAPAYAAWVAKSARDKAS